MSAPVPGQLAGKHHGAGPEVSLALWIGGDDQPIDVS